MMENRHVVNVNLKITPAVFLHQINGKGSALKIGNISKFLNVIKYTIGMRGYLNFR